MLTRYLLAPLAALLLLAAAPRLALAQTGAVGIGTTAPNASAALDIVSSAKGLLLPRLTQAQVAAIASPATGLLVFQTDGTPGFYYNAGTPAAPGWQLLGAGTGTGDNLGNHTATQALNLQGNALVGTGASVGTAVGLGIRADGGLNLGQNGVGHNLLLGYRAGQALAPSLTATDSLGAFNQFNGYLSGANTTTGSGNLFIGYRAGQVNTTASGNQFIGYRAGQATTTGEGNQFSGFSSGLSNTTGYANVFSGPNSGYSNTSGYANQYLGVNAGGNSTTGSQNLFVGYGSGFFNVAGTSNTALGANAGPDRSTPALSNATALGAGAVVSQSNSLVLGSNASVGIGLSAPTEKLHVVGTIYSSAGGFRFPDGTLQTTAATGAAPQLALSGQALSISGGNTVALPTQQLALNGRNLSISGGNTVALPTDLDNQTLSISGSTISLTGSATSVTVPSSADNLGNHTATTNLNLNGYQLVSGGSTGLALTSGGSVGVGITTPAGQLANTGSNVLATDGNGISGQGLGWVNTTALGYAGVFYNANNNANAPGLAVKVASTGVAALDVSQGTAAGTAGTSLLRVQGSGNVGIGTSSPGQKLEVAGGIKFTGTGSALTFPDGSTQNTASLTSGSVVLNQTSQQSGANFNIGGNGYVGGRVGIGTTSPATLLDVRAADNSAALTVGKTDGTTGAVYLGNSGHGLARNYNGSANAVGLYTTAGTMYLSAAGVDNVNQFALLNGGNVGIGTATPGQRLEVAGQVFSSSGGFRFPDNTVQTTAGLTGGSAVLNQTSQQSGANFNITGSGTVGGQLTAGSATVSGQLTAGSGTVSGLLRAGSATVSGKVGIGTTSPGHPLTVQADASSNSALLGFNTSAGLDKYNFSLRGGGLNLSESGVAGGRLFVQDGGNVGIGTTTPGQKLDVNGNASVSGNVGIGGGSLTAYKLNVNGNTLLQGPLQVGTNAQGGSLAVVGSGGSGTTLDQQQLFSNGYVGAYSNWQSFTAGLTGNLTQLDLKVNSPLSPDSAPGMLYVYEGEGTGGTLLSSQAITYQPVSNGTYQQYTLATPVPVVIGKQYTYLFTTQNVRVTYVDVSQTDVYSGGRSDRSDNSDYSFRTYVTGSVATPLLTVQSGGNTGIGTASPGQKLEVAGQVFSSTGGFRFPDNTVQTTAVTAATGTQFVLNQTSQQSGASFNISGNGTIGGQLTTGSATVSGNSTVGGSSYVSGNLGIGTSGTATQKLDVNGGILARASGAISNQGAYLQWNRSGGQGETSLLNQQGGGTGGILFGKSDQSNNTTEWGRFDSNGNLGIGTTNPIARLHVSGSASATPSGSGTSYFSATTPLQGPGVPNGGGARATAAYFDGGQVWVNSVIVAGALNTTSDRRIKRVIGLSDPAADLALLNQLRITDYTYLDQHANTDQVVKKVIAQEVEAVLPAAVSRSTQAIPNVYEKATRVSYAQGQLTVSTAKPHELPASGGRLRFYTPANESLDVDVTVVDAHTVRFASAEAHAAGLFVYGKYVDDFRSVDYDALTTLNVSATQELARQVAALQAQNAALQARTATAEADHASLLTMQAQLARLLSEQPTATLPVPARK